MKPNFANHFLPVFLVLAALLLWKCSEGTTPGCMPPRTVCSGICVNTQNDPANCGGCGVRCDTGQYCEAGVCTQNTTCTPPLVICAGECVDTRYNPRHCGGCGNACDSGQLCNNGICTGGACPAGQTDCPGSGCVDLRSNPDNCGSCGNDCGDNACYEGACLTDCPTGLTICSGRCVDLQKDVDNCGSCGRACAAGETCLAGECSLRCPEGFQNCSGVCVDTGSDHGNCGSCGHACAAGEVCDSGSCRTGGCVSPMIECSGGCYDPRTDENHCGNCTTVCSAGQSCVDGTCGVVCPPGQTLCSVRCVDTATDEANCGGCGRTCRSDQLCLTGSCSCPEAFTECSGACIDTQNNPAHCGRCNNPCLGSEACVRGSCSLDCDSGLTPCSGYCVDTSSDRHNCGGCGVECSTLETCIGGDCTGSSVCPADSCSTAIDVTGGGRFTGSTTCAGDDYSGTCGGSAGREIVFKFTLAATQDVFISTQGSSFDTVLYVRRGVCDSGTDIYCNDDEHGTLQSELNPVDLAAGTYYVFLDAYFSSSYGNYVFDIYMTDTSFEGDRCGDPEYVDVATATEVSGDTCPWYWFDANPDAVGCSGLAEGKDRLYYFIVKYSPMTLTFETCGGASWDTVLYVRSACNEAGGGVVCNDDGCGGGTYQSTITHTFDPGLYYLWVDGWSGDECGGYTVSISR
jgi:hypothetical protein